MIKCDGESVEIIGRPIDTVAEFGLLAEYMIKIAPKKEIRLTMAAMITEALRIAIKNGTEGGEENEES